jgi:hypothetical protein
MPTASKLRATLQVTALGAAFWGLAGLLGRAGYELLRHGFSFPLETWLALGRTLLGYGLIGGIAGACFAAGLLAYGRRHPEAPLPRRVAVWLGAITGVPVFLALQVSGLGIPATGPSLAFSLLALGTGCLLGAAFGVAIRDTAGRSTLPRSNPTSTILSP